MAKSTWINRGWQGCHVLKSNQVFNIDNGSGTTVDDVLFSDLPYAVDLVEVRAVYQEATDTAGVASANFKLGLTAGGATLVAATALEISKAVGSATSATIAIERVAAGATVFIRHTGIAATEAGSYYVQAVVRPVP